MVASGRVTRDYTLACVVLFPLGLGLGSRQELNKLTVKIILRMYYLLKELGQFA